MANRQHVKQIKLAAKNRKNAEKAAEIQKKLEDVENRILAGKTYVMINRKRVAITIVRDGLKVQLEKLAMKIARRQYQTAA